MNVSEAARYYGKARSTIYRWIKRGKIRAERRGRRWFVFPKEPTAAATTSGPGGGDVFPVKTTSPAWDGVSTRTTLTQPTYKEPEGVMPDDARVRPAQRPDATPPPVAETGGKQPKPEAPMQWPWYVDRASAEADGRDPSDFRFDQWPISDLQLRLPEQYDDPSRAALVYECRIPADTPEANKYVEQADGYTKLPDPIGMALAWVEFELRHATTKTLLDSRQTGHADGRVRGFLTGKRAPIWQHLQPGGVISVRLTAQAKFYFLNEKGGAQLDYANMGLRGYFGGPVLMGDVRVLMMDENGNLSIDG